MKTRRKLSDGFCYHKVESAQIVDYEKTILCLISTKEKINNPKTATIEEKKKQRTWGEKNVESGNYFGKKRKFYTCGPMTNHLHHCNFADIVSKMVNNKPTSMTTRLIRGVKPT